MWALAASCVTLRSTSGPLSAFEGRRRARDVWRQKDAGAVVGEYQALVAPHGVALVRLYR